MRTYRFEKELDDRVSAYRQRPAIPPSRQAVVSFLIDRGLKAEGEGRKDADAQQATA